MPQSPVTSHVRLARSRPAAVALLVLIMALSTRGTAPPSGETAETGWPGATTLEHGATVATPAMIRGDVGSTPATMVRVASGEVADAADADVALDPGDGSGYPHPVDYLTVEVDGAPVALAFMDVPPTGPVNGRAVLILHDRGDAGDEWAPTIDALAADGYRVVVPDQVGHGLSARLAAGLPVEALAAQAAILLDSLGAPRVAVVGDGLGADVAVRLAGAHAGLVERMVLLSEGSTVAPERAILHDPVRGHRLPLLVVGDGEGMDPLLLGFLDR